MTYEPMYSAQALVAKCRSHGRNISWNCWSPLSRHYKKWG